MIFHIRNIYTEIEGDVPKLVHEFCTLRYSYWMRRRNMHKPRMVEKKACYLFNGNTLPTGWVGSLLPELKKRSIEYNVVDHRVKPSKIEITHNARHENPRDNQRSAVLAARKSGRGIIEHGTGTGKTDTAAYLIAMFKVPTLYLVPSVKLLEDAYAVFTQVFGGQSVGAIGGGYKDALKPIIICTVQSMHNYDADAHSAGLLLIDESHHVNVGPDLMANKWLEWALKIDAYYRFAFTGSLNKPGAVERRCVEMATGRVIDRYTVGEGIRDGYLINPEVIMHQVEHGDNTGLDWSAVRQKMGTHAGRNAKIKHLATYYLSGGKKVLIIVNRVETHGKLLKRLLGAEAHFISGETEHATRQRITRKFVESTEFILIGTVFGEGVDIPALDVVIRASGGKAEKDMIQNIGRLLRKTKDKTAGTFIDFFDEDYVYKDWHRCVACKTWLTVRPVEECRHCGSFGIERTPRKVAGYLLQHSRERYNILKAQGYTIKICDQEGTKWQK